QLIHTHTEHIVIQIEILQQHFGMENVFLVNVNVDHLVQIQGFIQEEVLDGIDLVIDVQLATFHIAGKTTYPVIHRHDIGIELVNQVVQGLQRRNDATGGN